MSEDRLSPNDPRYVQCTEQFNKEAIYYQPSGKVWVVTCYECKQPLHLPYDPNLREYIEVQGWRHSGHAEENRRKQCERK
jgi:hypothetical protein